MPSKIKLVKLQPEAIVSASPAKLKKLTKDLMKTPSRFHFFGCIEDNDRHFIGQLSKANPVAGYYFGAATRLLNLSTLNSLREVIPLALEAVSEVAEIYKLPLTVKQMAKLEKRLMRAIPTTTELNPEHDPFKAFNQLHKMVISQKLLQPKIAFNQVLQQAHIFADIGPMLDVVYEPPPETFPTPEDMEKTKPQHSGYTSNEDKKTIDHWPVLPLPGTVPPSEDPEMSDGSPLTTTDDGTEAFWIHWTAIEWHPLTKSEAAMLFCLKPVNTASAFSTGGDQPQMIELPGGQILKYPKHGVNPLQGGHVMRQWNQKKYETYWVEMPERADFVRLGIRNHLYTALVQPERGSDINWEELKKKLEDALKDKKVKEKIKEQIEKQAGKLLEGVTLFGFGLGKLGSSIAELMASLIMELIEWLLEELFSGKKLQPVVVVHKTVYTSLKPESFVTYHSKDANGEETHLTPHALKNPKAVHGDTNPFIPLPKKGKDQMSGIQWTGESEVPDKGPLPSMMINTRKTPVYWPSNQRYGGHVFIPLMKKGEAFYVVAIRTEVRKAFCTF